MNAARPTADIEACARVHCGLLPDIEALTDADMRRPSALPDWTVGHLCTHLARNAESHCRRLAAAVRGEMIDQYVGGRAGRAADIEAGASRDAAAIIADVRDTIDAFAAALDAMPDDVWGSESRDASGVIRPASQLPERRWQEVEVHHVDLACGYRHVDWPDEFVDRFLPLQLARVPARLAAGTKVPDLSALADRDVLAWCYDRITIDGLPPLRPYG